MVIDFTEQIGNMRHGLADVVELVDTPDLGSGAVRCGSSSLPIRTIDGSVDDTKGSAKC